MSLKDLIELVDLLGTIIMFFLLMRTWDKTIQIVMPYFKEVVIAVITSNDKHWGDLNNSYVLLSQVDDERLDTILQLMTEALASSPNDDLFG